MARFWVGPLRRFPAADGPWGVDYKDLAGKRKRKTWGQRQKDGEQGRRKLIRELEDGTHTASSTKTFGDALDDWLKDSARRKELGELSGGTVYGRRGRVRNHIGPALGHIRLDRLTTDDVRPFIEDMAVRTGTLHEQLYEDIKAAVDLAVYHGSLTISPFTKKRLRVPPRRKPNTYCPTLSEGRALWHAIQERPRGACHSTHITTIAMFALTLFGGLRRSEVCGLRWEDVDFANGNLIVRHGYTYHDRLGPTKGRKERLVPMAAQIRESLTRCGERDSWPRDGYALANSNGGAILNSVRHTFRLVMRHAGFVDESGKTKWRLHDNRHYAGSVWLHAGMSVYEVSKLLGHASIKTTEQI